MKKYRAFIFFFLSLTFSLQAYGEKERTFGLTYTGFKEEEKIYLPLSCADFSQLKTKKAFIEIVKEAQAIKRVDAYRQSAHFYSSLLIMLISSSLGYSAGPTIVKNVPLLGVVEDIGLYIKKAVQFFTPRVEEQEGGEETPHSLPVGDEDREDTEAESYNVMPGNHIRTSKYISDHLSASEMMDNLSITGNIRENWKPMILTTVTSWIILKAASWFIINKAWKTFSFDSRFEEIVSKINEVRAYAPSKISLEGDSLKLVLSEMEKIAKKQRSSRKSQTFWSRIFSGSSTTRAADELIQCVQKLGFPFS
jgi:hypothetical protein